MMEVRLTVEVSSCGSPRIVLHVAALYVTTCTCSGEVGNFVYSRCAALCADPYLSPSGLSPDGIEGANATAW